MGEVHFSAPAGAELAVADALVLAELLERQSSLARITAGREIRAAALHHRQARLTASELDVARAVLNTERGGGRRSLQTFLVALDEWTA